MRKIIRKFMPEKLRQQRHYMSWTQVLQYWFFQRVLRINASVPWPVHWSSVVVQPERVQLRSSLRPPGFVAGTYVQATNGITVGENVWFAPGVKIVSANHDLDDYDAHPATGPIVIGDNCWIAANVVILPGVELGNHVVVAAGAVVNRSFPDDCLVGGLPARLIRRLGPYQGKQKQTQPVLASTTEPR